MFDGPNHFILSNASRTKPRKITGIKFVKKTAYTVFFDTVYLQVFGQLFACHANAVVADGQRTGLGVVVGSDLPRRLALQQLRSRQPPQTPLVVGVRSVRDQVAPGDLAMPV